MNADFLVELNKQLVNGGGEEVMSRLQSELEPVYYKILSNILNQKKIVSWKWGYCKRCFLNCSIEADIALFLDMKDEIVFALAYIKSDEPNFYESIKLCIDPTIDKRELEYIAQQLERYKYSSDPNLNGDTMGEHGIYAEYV